MTWTFQLPPLPALSTGGTLAMAAGLVLLGVLLMLWGRKRGWAILMVIGAGTGVVAGGIFADTFHVNVAAARLGGAIALALVGLFCASGLWTVLLAAMAGVVSAGVLVCQSAAQTGQPVPGFESSAQELGPYFRDLFDFAWNTFVPVARGRTFEVLGICGLAIGAPIVLGIVLQRLMTILATSFFGAAVIVGGLLVAAVTLWPNLQWPLVRNWHAVAGVLAGLMIIGIVVQYRRALIKAAPPAEPPPVPPPQR